MSDDTTTETAPAAGPQTYPSTSRKLGELVKVKPAGVVTRPDGTTHIVVKGGFYLDQVGTFLVDGVRVVVE